MQGVAALEHNATMKLNVGGIRLKLGTALDSQPRASVPRDGAGIRPRWSSALAKTIAAHTVKVLLEGEMLDPASASDELLKYGISLERGLTLANASSIFFFPTKAGWRWF